VKQFYKVCNVFNSYLDAPYQKLPTICEWIVDAPQTCVVTFLSNPISVFKDVLKIGKYFHMQKTKN